MLYLDRIVSYAVIHIFFIILIHHMILYNGLDLYILGKKGKGFNLALISTEPLQILTT